MPWGCPAARAIKCPTRSMSSSLQNGYASFRLDSSSSAHVASRGLLCYRPRASSLRTVALGEVLASGRTLDKSACRRKRSSDHGAAASTGRRRQRSHDHGAAASTVGRRRRSLDHGAAASSTQVETDGLGLLARAASTLWYVDWPSPLVVRSSGLQGFRVEADPTSPPCKTATV